MPVKDNVAAHQFTRPITIQKPTETPNGSGGFVTTWADYYSCWADIQNFPNGRGLFRKFIFMQLYPTGNTMIVIRYAPGTAIDATMRVKSVEGSTTHYYQIVGPPENMQRANVSIYLPCQEVQAPGVS